MKNFWDGLKRPIFAVAPMANVTDEAFRRMFAECGRPTVFWTEFVSVEGLLSSGKEHLLPDLWFEKDEHPIVAQIFGAKPEQFAPAAEIIYKLGFDGIDINMGCPDRAVEKQGAGAALIKQPELAKQIIRATKEGAHGLPVSVKTRIGYTKNQLAEWLPALLEEDLAALTVHLRTRSEMSKVAAHWELAPEVVALRDRYAPKTVAIGNGDVASLDDARMKTKASGLDGIMIGRGIFGNPWFFGGATPTVREKIERLVRHTEVFESLYKSDLTKKEGKIKNFEVMKKHYKAYANGFDGAKELRIRLMDAESAAEVKAVAEEFLTGTHKEPADVDPALP
ncbi:MAG: tRNA-dihydrouridine synthase [Candidatus Pacebacteria bacterium]|nr:tRNA-dihydrouridine synthase [Candidatus Paceibacterota bacterium]